MKQIKKLSLAIVAGATIGILLSGCATTRIKRLSGNEFVSKAKQIEKVSSFNWTTYIGSSAYGSSGTAVGDFPRVYLEFQRPSLLWNIIGTKVVTTVYWTNLSELPTDIADQVKARKTPWKPWWMKTNKTERTGEFSLPE